MVTSMAVIWGRFINEYGSRFYNVRLSNSFGNIKVMTMVNTTTVNLYPINIKNGSSQFVRKFFHSQSMLINIGPK